MVLQKDQRLREEINVYGCYFMSILFLANKYTGLQLSIPIIEKIFNDCVELGYILHNNQYKAFIVSAEGIFKHLGFNVKYYNRHDPPGYICSSDEIEILCVRVGSRNTKHFVVGDGNGNIAYDPMGVSDVRKLDSKRVFKLL